jgi:resuscitation-promoting factor RpfA
MMTRTKMLCARAGASAIAAALALSPTYAAAPKPIVDLSKSPALSGKPAQPAKSAPRAKPMVGPVDEQTAEIGGGAVALLVLGAGAFAVSRSRRKRREEAAWNTEAISPEPRDPLFDEPMFEEQPATSEASAFAWGSRGREQNASRRDETWVERAYRGPTPENPSLSLRARLKRAAFFDKREREAAAGSADPVEADAGLPATAAAEEREREAA